MSFTRLASEVCTPNVASLFLRRSQKKQRIFSSHTKPVNPGDNFPMRFNTNRDIYYTTNSSGQVVRIENPGKQFQTNFNKSPYSDPASLPFKLEKTDHHPTKPYRALAGVCDKRRSLELCIKTLIIDRTAALEKNPIGKVFLARYKRKSRYPVRVNPYKQIPKRPQFLELDLFVVISPFHVYYMDDWPRVKMMIMDVVEVYGLQCLLVDSEEEYTRAFPNSKGYYYADVQMSYLIMSLVHGELFANFFEEAEFYEKLRHSTQKTALVLSLVDSVYHHFNDIDPPVLGTYWARKYIMSHLLPGHYPSRQDVLTACEKVFKYYTADLSAFTDDEDAEPWYKFAHERVLDAFLGDFTWLESAKERLECLRKEGKTDTLEYLQLEAQVNRELSQDFSYVLPRDLEFSPIGIV